MKSLNKIRCIFLLLALLIFTNCEKDLYEEAVIQTSGRANVGNQTFTAKYIDGDEATGIGTVLQELIPGSIVGGRGLQNEDYTVQYDQVLKVIDNLGNKTYMFRVVHPEASSEKFFNMVLQQQTDGNIYVRMIEYKMTTSFAILYNSGQKQIKDFEGEYYNKLISHHLGTIDENAFHEWDEWGGNPGNGDGSPGPGSNGPVIPGTNNNNGPPVPGSANPCPEGGGTLTSGNTGPGGVGDGDGGAADQSSCYILVGNTTKIEDGGSCYLNFF